MSVTKQKLKGLINNYNINKLQDDDEKEESLWTKKNIKKFIKQFPNKLFWIISILIVCIGIIIIKIFYYFSPKPISHSFTVSDGTDSINISTGKQPIFVVFICGFIVVCKLILILYFICINYYYYLMLKKYKIYLDLFLLYSLY